MSDVDLAQRLTIKADMIQMGEKIVWGSDSAIMREAAAEIERLRNALAFYADGSNWRMGGPLDPNSGNFTGGPAREVIEHILKRK